MENKDIESLRVNLGLLIMAHKALIEAERLKETIEGINMLYPKKLGFKLDDTEIAKEMSKLKLERQEKSEREFAEYVIKHYCSNQDADGQVGELPKNPSRWN